MFGVDMLLLLMVIVVMRGELDSIRLFAEVSRSMVLTKQERITAYTHSLLS